LTETPRVIVSKRAVDENVGGARTNPGPDDGQDVLSKFGERAVQ
jgi:hypothetical protein